MKNQAPTGQRPAQQQEFGVADVKAIIANAREQIPQEQLDIFDKVVLSGMRIMFDKQSHQMMLDELNKPGPLATRISNGMIALIYMLWEKSNKTIPPQLIVPVTLTLTLRAFEFLLESKDPDATREVLGEAVAESVEGVMSRFGATPDKIPALARGLAGQTDQAGAAPEPDGLMAAATGSRP